MLKPLLYGVACWMLLSIQSFAKETLLEINPLKEIEILQTLDIDPNFVEDERYIEMKKNIDALKTMYFLKTLKRGNLFMPNLQELLGESNIPNTFLYMAMVESKFLADSKSHKHAAGLWQFMPATAKKYKLTQNSHIDERLDPIKSTKAAIQYLKYLHRRFKKWYLAAMAYNCGEGRLAKAIKEAGTDELAILLDDNPPYLPKETRDYIRRILVAALLAHDKNIIKKNNKNHLFGYCSNKKLVKLFFKGGESLQSISEKIGVPLVKLKDCNPQLLQGKLPPGKKMHYVYLPQDLADQTREKLTNSNETFVYHVKPNDTLFRISKRFNIRMNTIKILNPQLGRVLRIGEPLTLIGKNPFATKENNTTKKSPKVIKNRIEIYTIQEEKSLQEISIKFNNKLSTLKKLNPNLPKKLQSGTKIRIVKDVPIPDQNETNSSANKTIHFKTKPIIEHNNTHKTPATNTSQPVALPLQALPPAKEKNSSLINTKLPKESNQTKSIELHQTKENNQTKHKEQNQTKETNQTKPLHKKSAVTVKLPTYKTVTYTIEANDTIETIAHKLHLSPNTLLHEGNILILKIKDFNQTTPTKGAK